MTEIHIMCHQKAEGILKLLPGFSFQITDLILKSFNVYHLFTAEVANTNADGSPAGINLSEVGRYCTIVSGGELGNCGGLARTG